MEPYGEAPSTHIVKQSHVRMNSIVTNEQLCLLTAKQLGIEIPDSFIINTGDAKEEEVLFATKRYDIISTTVYEASTRDMGIAIGGKLSIDKINAKAFACEAQKVGLNIKMATSLFDKLAHNFENALKETARQLEQQGFPASKELCEKILKSGGFANL